ncbi:hypothetical protein, partial [Paenibacillus odorifer]
CRKGDKLVNSVIGVRKPQQEIMVAVAVDPANDHTSAVSDSADQRMIILGGIGLRSPANDHTSAVSDSADLICKKIRHLEYYRTA